MLCRQDKYGRRGANDHEAKLQQMSFCLRRLTDVMLILDILLSSRIGGTEEKEGITEMNVQPLKPILG